MVLQQTKIFFAVLICCLFLPPRSLASPPFLTDDPSTLGDGHWQSFLFSTMDYASNYMYLSVPIAEVNIGIKDNMELDATMPYAIDLPQEGIRAAGFSDILAEFKYRFINQTKTLPDVGFAPVFTIPTGDAERGLGNSRVIVTLPILLQKNWGPWRVYGGGGYTFNPAPGALNYSFASSVVERTITKHLTLGAELFSQGAYYSVDSRSFTILDAGGNYFFTNSFGLLFSAGQSIFGEKHRVGLLSLTWIG